MRRSLAVELRRLGLDVSTAYEAGRAGRDDESQLELAAEQGRTLVTSNRADFARLHARWMRAGRSHAGIVHVPQQLFGVGETIRRLARLAQWMEPEEMIDREEYLTNWG